MAKRTPAKKGQPVTLTQMRQHQRFFQSDSAVVHEHGQKGISSAHDTRHVHSVAHHASKIARHMGGGHAVAILAEVAGYRHDRIRDKTEVLKTRNQGVARLMTEFKGSQNKGDVERMVDAMLAQKAERVEGTSDYGPKDDPTKLSSDDLTVIFVREEFSKRFGPQTTKRLLNAIELAGKMPKPRKYRKDLVHASLVYADKFFEANGAFIAFRRCYFMGERGDRRKELQQLMQKGSSKTDAMRTIVLNETEKRLKAYSNLSKIPTVLHPFVEYQANWQHRLRDGLKNRRVWAMRLMEVLFDEGLKRKPKSLEQTIREYHPVGKIDAEFKTETLRYFNGELWDTFTELVNKPRKRK